MTSGFVGKTIIITGGASGIGLATARLLHEQGAQVVLWDIQREALYAAAQALNAQCALVDCTDAEQINQALANYPTLDAMIHCAGVLYTGLFEQLRPEQHAHIVAVNLNGAVQIAYAALPRLRKTGGSLVLLASISSYYGAPEFVSYAATKAGVLNLAQGLRIELEGSGIHVGVVCPGFTNTPMLHTENRRQTHMIESDKLFLSVGTPERVAQAILRGMARRQFMIYPDWRPRFGYWMSRYAAMLSFFLVRRMYRKALRG